MSFYYAREHVALVTGGSRGIGRETVKSLAESGIKVAFTYHQHRGEAGDVMNQLIAVGIPKHQLMCLRMDLTQKKEILQVVQTVIERWGTIDILVNNAVPPGWTNFNLLHDPEDRWEEMIDGGLTGTFYACRFVLPYMIQKKWGRIVNMTSTIALRGKENSSHYGAAKAGLIGFTFCLAQDFAKYNILSNVIAPGLVRTERVFEQQGIDYIQEYADRNPSHRPAEPRDIANTVLYLCSEQNTFINGQIISVDGGMNPR